jgi:excisionase family DNA binding protein
MEIELTYEYVKREIDKLNDFKDKLDRAIELRAIYNIAEENFNNNIIYKIIGTSISANGLKAKSYLDSVIDSLKKVLDKPIETEVYTVESLSKFLNISKSSVYKLAESGKIRYSKPSGKIIYFSKADVEEYLSKKSTTKDDINREVMEVIYFKKNKRNK